MLKVALNPFRISRVSLFCKPVRFKVKLLVLVFFALSICSLAPQALALSAAAHTTAAPATPAPEEHGLRRNRWSSPSHLVCLLRIR